MNKYTIIYGFDTIQSIFDNKTILIEPRKRFIDKIKKEKITLVSKVLMGSNISRQINLYTLDDYNIVLENPKAFTSRDEIYTTSLSNIIKMYNIQEISHLVINIKIDNIKEVLDNTVLYNNIIKKISMCHDETDCHLLSYFNIIQKGIYEHKNINIRKPNICLFPCQKISCEENNNKDDKNDNYKNFFDFVKLYDINILTKSGKIINDKCSIQNVKKNNEIEIDENLVNNLHLIFLSEQGNKSLDIIIQFNPLYLITQNNFEIIYPIENDILYVYKQHDIIYGNKDTMYNLYNVLKSNEFKDYIERAKVTRGKLYKFFSKSYFYDYISKVFNLIIKN